MEKNQRCSSSSSSLIIFLILFTIFLTGCKSQLSPIDVDDAGGHAKTYIIYVIHPEKGATDLLGDEDLAAWYRSFLPNSTLSSGKPRLVYSYRHAISGFAARLTPEELREVQSIDGVVHTLPDRQVSAATTYTYSYLGLSQPKGAWSSTFYGEGMIIGVIDYGVLATHPSFSDDKMPPPPPRWNGKCEFSGFGCNNKIIGGVGFLDGNRTSPDDDNGHGTHCAGIAAGNRVDDASVLGSASGTAAGMAPKAHLAIYKACHKDLDCGEANILAAIDQAIRDGVDVISMSLGSLPDWNFTTDPVVHGSLGAAKKGVLPVTCAGNQGPEAKTLDHDAPWTLVVGASTTDRRIRAVVKLGNKRQFEGESGFQPSGLDSDKLLPLVFPGANGDFNASYCFNGSLDHYDVIGKMVLCNSGGILDTEKGEVVYAAGGAAMIVMSLFSEGNDTFAEAHVLPVSRVNYMDGQRILAYLDTASPAEATISFEGTVFGARPAPAVASFSSRGPGQFNGGILKPDVLAPGVNILAAWPFPVGPPKPSDGLATGFFNFERGTSMATPHVAGIAALIKSKYPAWSPAAVFSAIITSAKDTDLDGLPISDHIKRREKADVFATGAGEVNPNAAMDPGLVYDLKFSDYIGYICGLGYSDDEVSAMAGEKVECGNVQAISAGNLNYPSILVQLSAREASQTIERTATNVGPKAKEVYRARITEPEGVRVDLSTYELSFSRVQQEISFKATLTLEGSHGVKANSKGKIEWVSDDHVVTSPIAVIFK